MKENQKGSRKSRRFRSLFFSIAATYLALCLLMVACAFLFLQFSSSSLRSKLEGIAASRAESGAAELAAQMDNFTQLTEVISSSPVLHALPDSLEKGLADWVPEANRLRAQMVSARANYGSAHLSVLGVYYPDAGVFVTDSALYTPDMMDYYTAHDTDISLLVRAYARGRDDAAILEDGKCWIIRTIYSRGEAYAYVLLRFDLPEFCREHLEARDALCVLENGGVRAVKEELHTIIDEMIVLNETEKDGTPTIVDEMVRYINENYASQGLSLGTLENVFQLSESAISRVFRQQMDMTVLEYIQKLRVHKAKELLADHSVKDTALAVGFWDTQALIRVFKKYESITPGQYKESAERKESARKQQDT